MSDLANGFESLKEATQIMKKQLLKSQFRFNAKVDGEYVDCRDVDANPGEKEYHVQRAIRRGKFNARFERYWREHYE